MPRSLSEYTAVLILSYVFRFGGYLVLYFLFSVRERSDSYFDSFLSVGW